MSNFKKTAEISIRLPKQTSLPKPVELIEMAHEARRAKKRIELPWQPEGRPEPALLTIKYDEQTAKSTWSIYDSNKSEASIAWTEVDPDPTKVVLALRDWYTHARETEGWYRPGAPQTPFPDTVTQPKMIVGQQPPSGHPSQQPYPQTPGGVPTFAPGPAPQYGYQYPAQQAVPPAPPHWAQSFPPAPGPIPQPDVDNPLPPEMWALHNAAAAAGNPLIGDILVAAGVIPTRTLQAALTLQNTGSMERPRIGEILVSSGALPSNVLQAAVKLQDMARAKSITHHRVTELLRQLHTTGTSLTELLQNMPLPMVDQTPIRSRGDQMLEDEGKVSSEENKKFKDVLNLLKNVSAGDDAVARAQVVIDLLRKASIITEDALLQEEQATRGRPLDTVKALLVRGLVEVSTVEAAFMCQKLLDRDRLKLEQAVIALGYCSRMRVSLPDAISDLNWLIPLEGL